MYTDAEVAALLQTSVKIIHKFARTKRIPAVKVGREWRFRRKEIQRYVEGK